MIKRVLNAAIIAGFILFVLACVAPLAFAADGAATAVTSVNFADVVMTLIGLAVAAIAAAGGVAVRALTQYLERRWGLTLDESTREYLDEALMRGIGWGRSKLDRVIDGNNLTIGVKNELVAKAMQYVTDRVPDALKHFNIDEARLRGMVEARLVDVLGVGGRVATTATAPNNPA